MNIDSLICNQKMDTLFLPILNRECIKILLRAVGVAVTQRETEVTLSPSCLAIPLNEIKRSFTTLHCDYLHDNKKSEDIMRGV